MINELRTLQFTSSDVTYRNSWTISELRTFTCCCLSQFSFLSSGNWYKQLMQHTHFFCICTYIVLLLLLLLLLLLQLQPLLQGAGPRTRRNSKQNKGWYGRDGQGKKHAWQRWENHADFLYKNLQGKATNSNLLQSLFHRSQGRNQRIGPARKQWTFLSHITLEMYWISDDEKQEDVAVGCNYLQLSLYWADNVWTSLMRKEPVDVVKKH